MPSSQVPQHKRVGNPVQCHRPKIQSTTVSSTLLHPEGPKSLNNEVSGGEFVKIQKFTRKALKWTTWARDSFQCKSLRPKACSVEGQTLQNGKKIMSTHFQQYFLQTQVYKKNLTKFAVLIFFHKSMFHPVRGTWGRPVCQKAWIENDGKLPVTLTLPAPEILRRCQYCVLCLVFFSAVAGLHLGLLSLMSKIQDQVRPGLVALDILTGHLLAGVRQLLEMGG